MAASNFTAVVKCGEFLFAFKVKYGLDLLQVSLLRLKALLASGNLGQKEVEVLLNGLELDKIFRAVCSF